MIDWIFNTFLRLWRVNDPLPSMIDAIVSVSYGVTPQGLATGSVESTKTSAEIYREHGNENTALAFGVFTPTAEIYGNLERWAREDILKQDGIPCHCQVYAGPVASSIEEARNITQALSSIRTFRTIVVVTSAGHSRRAKFVWKRECPECDIRVVCFPDNVEIQKDHPMVALRNRWSWLFVNIAVWIIFLMPFGYWYFRKNCKTMRQVTVK